MALKRVTLTDGRYVLLPEKYEDYRNSYVLDAKSIDEHLETAINEIEKERSGEQFGLYSRFNNLNRAMGKYFRFQNFTTLAGISGVGKSYILSMLYQDFCNVTRNANNKGINDDFKFPIIILHFGYEMSAHREIIRMTGSHLNKSFNYLLSSMFDENGKYNRISDKEFDTIKSTIYDMKGKPIYFINNPGTPSQMYYTIYEFVNKFPDCKVIVGNDHLLLNTPSKNDKNEIDLLVSMAKMGIKIRDSFHAMTIFLSQLNGDIMSFNRRTTPMGHYPIRTDLHGSNQIYHASDNVLIFHRPEVIDIQEYGPKRLVTQGLIHGAMVKSRNGSEGDLWFKNRLFESNIDEATIENFMYSGNTLDLEM